MGLSSRGRGWLRQWAMSGPGPRRSFATRATSILVKDCAECPLCGIVVPTFDDGGHTSRAPRRDIKCPECESFERHRAMWLFLRDRSDVLTDQLRVLHMAPDRSIMRLLKDRANLDYVTADLDPSKGMLEIDLTAIGMPDDSFDMIIVAHVLEHIPDDVAAMREMRRVLRPGGMAVLAVPMHRPETVEDLSIEDPAERHRLYGQPDHVRSYGFDGVFEERLRTAGFVVRADHLPEAFDPRLRRRYRLWDGVNRPRRTQQLEPVFCCTIDRPVVPRPPTVSRRVALDPPGVVLSWEDAVTDVGPPVQGYVVVPFVESAAQPPMTFHSTATRQVVNGLVSGETYRFRVQAFNEIGLGACSTETDAVTPGVVSAAPPPIEGAVPGDEAATVSWGSPSAEDAALVTGYVVTPFVGLAPHPSTIFASTSTTQTVTGLANGTEYRFRVRAMTAAGLSDYSTVSPPVTPEARVETRP